MGWLRDFAFLVALAGWTGAGLYFTFLATPAVFARFERPVAGEVVGAMFPGYYRLAITAAVVLAVAVAARATAGRPGAGLALVLAAVILGAALVGGLVLQPRIHELRLQLHPQQLPGSPGSAGGSPGGGAGAGAPASPEPSAEAAFARLHRLSMGLNLLSLLAALALWGVVAGTGL